MGSLAVVVPFSAPPDPQAAQRMLAAAPHRGTDLDVRVCGNAVLGVSSTPGAVHRGWSEGSGSVS